MERAGHPSLSTELPKHASFSAKCRSKSSWPTCRIYRPRLNEDPGKRHRFRPTLRRLYPNDVHVGTDVADCSFAKASHRHLLAFGELFSHVAIDLVQAFRGGCLG